MNHQLQLSKSIYCKSVQCQKILWLDQYKPEYAIETAKDSVLETGTEVGELARSLFSPYQNIEFNQNLSIMIEQTNQLLKEKPNIITEASFKYQNNFCSVDILKNDRDGLAIYEVKSSTQIHDIYLDDISYQVYILKNLGYSIKSANIVYLNSHYERKGPLELEKLFTIKEVTDIALSKQSEIKSRLKELTNLLNEEEPTQEIGPHCMNPYPCPYWNYCTKSLPKPNIFQIRNMQNKTKFKLYHQGIYQYKDLLTANINEKYKQQIEFELKQKEPFIAKKAIKEFLATLTYPLYFLDFETYQQAIPEYDGIRPYMQIPFQYSIHYIEKESGSLLHKEFLAQSGTDPRRSLACQLVKDIPKNTCVLAYNMSFEKTVIKNLAAIYPDLKDHLLNIHDHIKDLMIPFINRLYYCKEMQGSYSIKYVLPALFPNDPTLDYHNLEKIHNGSEAMSEYASLSQKTTQEQQEIRTCLLEYCKLDTYAMVKIWEKLTEIISESKNT